MKKSAEIELNKLISSDKNCVHWVNICYHPLSENFMREFKDHVNWYIISRKQELSEKFIIEFKNKLHLKMMFIDKKITEKFYNTLLPSHYR